MEKYRPSSLDEYVFHDKQQEQAVRQMVADKTIPQLLLSGIQGSGKAQPLRCKIATPSGWTTMGEIKPGDQVIAANGDTTTVLSIHPQGVQPTYRITLDDGGQTEASLDHLWQLSIMMPDDSWVDVIMDTAAMLVHDGLMRIPHAAPVNHSQVPLIDGLEEAAYELGVYLSHIVLHAKKAPALESYSRAAQQKIKQYKVDCAKDEVRIPNEIFTQPPNVRQLLLNGIVDTAIKLNTRTPRVRMDTTTQQFVNDLKELSWSLGQDGPQYVLCGEGKGILNQSLQRSHRSIHTIEKIEDQEVQCIYIDHPSHLYITDDYIVTHNTTLAQILINEMELDESDVLTINASDERGIDTFRNNVKTFALSSALGRFKIVHLEEADMLTPQAQSALKSFMEETSEHVRFILTCNHVNKIIPPIQSRCQHFAFKAADKEDITEYLVKILTSEHVKFGLSVLDTYVEAGYPDVRKIVNMLQQNSIKGELSPPRGAVGSSVDYQQSLLALLDKNKWSDIRALLGASVTTDEWESVYRFMYENLDTIPKFKDKAKQEEAFIVIADSLYKHTIVSDPEINMVSCVIRLCQI